MQIASATLRHELGRLGPVAAFADRQSDRHPRSLVDPATDIDLTIMQFHQALDDRKPKSRSTGPAIVA